MNRQLGGYVLHNPSNLDPDELTRLTNHFAGGSIDPAIDGPVYKIKLAATHVTQRTYGLPSTWTSGTTNADAWKPINGNIVGPTKMTFSETSSIRQ